MNGLKRAFQQPPRLSEVAWDGGSDVHRRDDRPSYVAARESEDAPTRSPRDSHAILSSQDLPAAHATGRRPSCVESSERPRARSSSLAPPRLTRSVIERAPVGVKRPDSDSVTSVSASPSQPAAEELDGDLLESEEVALQPARPRSSSEPPRSRMQSRVSAGEAPPPRSSHRVSRASFDVPSTKISAPFTSSPSRPTLIPAVPPTGRRPAPPIAAPIDPVLRTEPQGFALPKAPISMFPAAPALTTVPPPPAARSSRGDFGMALPVASAVGWQPAPSTPSWHDVSVMMSSRVGRNAAVAKKPFRLELSAVIAVVTGLLALGVMVAAILFVQSEDRPREPAPNAFAFSAPAPTQASDSPPIAATPAALPPTPPVAAPQAIAPAPRPSASPSTATKKPRRALPSALFADAPKPVRAMPAEVEPVKPKPAKKAGKSVEEELAELGEEQLRR